MNAEPSTSIPAEIIPYLDEIAERLWSGHAAVMVGAGFSKNARKATATAQEFPSWFELGDHFHRKLYNRLPDGSKEHYLNPLKLADEVQAAFGRPVLDQILRTHIPNEEYEPSELHIKLLELPWVDVFTVNYDTLLERTCDKITSRRFDYVVKKEDLVYSSRPRIIKLHGSFPSTRPFIISEEDFRRYPKEHAPFVNTVQQSLLENTLCLLGFSGDDPNFLHWIGWVRDNLGKENSPKLYLVGVLSITPAQRKLLEERNIVLVDMGLCNNVQGNHSKGLLEFFRYLADKKPSISLKWPHVDGHHRFGRDKLIKVWKVQRETYPNWVIAPDDSRESLISDFRINGDVPFKSISSENLTPPKDIESIYELNWHLEHALWPIPNDLIIVYEEVISRYNPYPQILTSDGNTITSDQKEFGNLNWATITRNWVELNLSLLRLFREEGMTQKWNDINTRLEKIKAHMSPEHIARWSYECCLNALFSFDLEDLKKQLKLWPVNMTLPFWEAKRAGLLAEFGDIAEAERKLEEALAAIRSNQQLSPVVTDYTWVSQESHVMFLLRAVKRSRNYTEHHQIEEDDTYHQFNERWNELTSYKCDPWMDWKIFDIKLKTVPVNQGSLTRKREFDIGRESITHHIGHFDNESWLGYSFLRYCEEIGLPFTLPSLNIAKSQAERAVERIANSSSYWAIVTLLRIGERKLADSLFSRDALVRMTVQHVDEWVERFILVLQRSHPFIAQGDRFKKENIGIRIAEVIPEILSRLCMKCSENYSETILILLKDIYKSPVRRNYVGVYNLTKRLIHSLPVRIQVEKIPEFLEFPLINEEDLSLREYPDPFDFLRLNRKYVRNFDINLINDSIIDLLLKSMVSNKMDERISASYRLGCLYASGLLPEKYIIPFGTALWDQDGQSEFPAGTRFYKWFFLKLPHPKSIDVVGRFKSYIFNTPFNEADNDDGTELGKVESSKPSTKMTGGNMSLCADLMYATKKNGDDEGIVWTEDEAIRLLNKLIAWWNDGKHNLKEPESPFHFMGLAEEFRARYENLVNILAYVVIPHINSQMESDIKDKLKSLLIEIREYGISNLRAYAASIHIYTEEQDSILQDICRAMAVSDSKLTQDAMEAILVLMRIKTLRSNTKEHDLLSELAQQIKWRRQVTLVKAMEIFKVCITDIPECLSKKILSDVIMGLNSLRNESDPKEKDSDIDLADRLTHRKAAAGLAYTLYRYYTTQKDQILPPVILEWQKICSDPEEFAEIRKQWIL